MPLCAFCTEEAQTVCASCGASVCPRHAEVIQIGYPDDFLTLAICRACRYHGLPFLIRDN